VKGFKSPSGADRLLDVGCHTGDFAMIAMQDTVACYGVDVSEPHIEFARKRTGLLDNFLPYRLSEAGFADEWFDYVCCWKTLEHMLDPKAELGCVHRIIKRDGVLAVSVPSAHFFGLKAAVLGSKRIGPLARLAMRFVFQVDYSGNILPHTHLYAFSPQSLRLILEGCGFRVVAMKCSPEVLHQRLLESRGLARRSFAALYNAMAELVWRLTAGRVALCVSLLAIARRVDHE
jgi:SAM-dependent methyltransferase